MSMLSAQIDELRATAEEIDWEFPFTASRLRGAADTIWQLRDDLQRANADNAKLRERLKASDDGRERQADNLIDKYHKIARLQTENAKLRELVRDIYEDMWHGGEWLEPYDQRMRELGIEVGE